MITQRELKAVVDERKRADRLARRPDVVDYLATQSRIEEMLGALRRRFDAGVSVEAGRWACRRLTKTAICVSWEKVLARLREIPSIARAIQRNQFAAEVLRQAAAREVGPDFVTTRNTVTFDVVDSSEEATATPDAPRHHLKS